MWVIDHLGNRFKDVSAMCDHWGVDYITFYSRKTSGRSLEECLTTEPRRGRPKISSEQALALWDISVETSECGDVAREALKVILDDNVYTVYTDHERNVFSSTNEMCKYWGVNENTFYSRKTKGLSLKDCLTQELSHGRGCTDHEGNVFKSIKEMCKHWGISPSGYRVRKSKGYSLEECLTAKVLRRRVCTDHEGNTFPNEIEMCKYWGMSFGTFRQRRRKGCSLEESLTSPVQKRRSGNPQLSHKRACVDHMGNKFESIKAMCEHWNVSVPTYRDRIKRGHSLEESLTSQSLRIGTSHACVDHMGNAFKSYKEMYEYWGVTKAAFEDRRRRGLSIEKCLSAERLCYSRKGIREPVIDHKGNKFRSNAEMCQYWGVNFTTFNKRKRAGFSIEECLSAERLAYRERGSRRAPVVDHEGNIFKSVAEMCQHWGINPKTYNYRKYVGHTLEECLTAEPAIRTKPIACTDHEGNTFKSIEDMCRYWNIKSSLYRLRRRKGYTLEECLIGKRGCKKQKS